MPFRAAELQRGLKHRLGLVGAVVGGVEGAAAATKNTFTNEHHIVRTWKTETTSDGRTIKVPVEIEVDENGKPIERPQ